MQPWVATLLGAGVVVSINLLGFAFLYGKMTETVEGLTSGLKAERNDRKEDIQRLDREQNEQWVEINATGRAVEKIKGKLQMNGT